MEGLVQTHVVGRLGNVGEGWDRHSGRRGEESYVRRLCLDWRVGLKSRNRVRLERESTSAFVVLRAGRSELELQLFVNATAASAKFVSAPASSSLGSSAPIGPAILNQVLMYK